MEVHNDRVIETLRGKLDELKIDLLNSPWNVFAAVISYDKQRSKYELIALGSGIKCLPDTVIHECPDGLLHDSHAEVICRRSFISFIFQQLLILKNENENSYSNEYLLYDEKLNKHYWNPDLTLLFYTSQSPCGDASIFKTLAVQNGESKRRRISNLSLAAGRETDLVGILRTKPGRADSPFASSMSCSDKICLWNLLGLQGALLSQFVAPIYLNSIFIGDDFDLDSVDRALKKRTIDIVFDESLTNLGYKNGSNELEIIKSSGLNIDSTKSDETSIFWHKGMTSPGHIVQGFKKGSSRPKKGIPFKLTLQSPLSRQFLFEKHFKSLKINSSNSYYNEKCNSLDYQKAKKVVLSHENFNNWIVRDEKLTDFRNKLH